MRILVIIFANICIFSSQIFSQEVNFSSKAFSNWVETRFNLNDKCYWIGVGTVKSYPDGKFKYHVCFIEAVVAEELEKNSTYEQNGYKIIGYFGDSIPILHEFPNQILKYNRHENGKLTTTFFTSGLKNSDIPPDSENKLMSISDDKSIRPITYEKSKWLFKNEIFLNFPTTDGQNFQAYENYTYKDKTFYWTRIGLDPLVAKEQTIMEVHGFRYDKKWNRAKNDALLNLSNEDDSPSKDQITTWIKYMEDTLNRDIKYSLKDLPVMVKMIDPNKYNVNAYIIDFNEPIDPKYLVFDVNLQSGSKTKAFILDKKNQCYSTDLLSSIGNMLKIEKIRNVELKKNFCYLESSDVGKYKGNRSLSTIALSGFNPSRIFILDKRFGSNSIFIANENKILQYNFPSNDTLIYNRENIIDFLPSKISDLKAFYKDYNGSSNEYDIYGLLENSYEVIKWNSEREIDHIDKHYNFSQLISNNFSETESPKLSSFTWVADPDTFYLLFEGLKGGINPNGYAAKNFFENFDSINIDTRKNPFILKVEVKDIERVIEN